MANPKDLQDLIKINLSIVKGSQPAGSVALACLVSTFTVPDGWTKDRHKIYSGGVTDILAAMVADGFTTTSKAYKQAEAFFDNEDPVDKIMIGRRDAGDANMTATINAISAENDTYALFATESRTKAEQLQLAGWTEPRWKFYYTISREPGALDKAAGTFVDAAFNAKYKKTAATYYVAAEATGFGPVIITSAAGTFSIENAMTLVLKAPGDAGTVTKTIGFAATAPSVLSSNAGDYALSDGGTITAIFDDLEEVTITLEDDPDYFPDGIGAAATEQLVDFLNDKAPQVTWSVDTNKVRVTSQRKGTNTKIQFTGGTAIATIGFVVGSTSGTGDFAFADEATAQEIADKINSTAAGVSQVTEGTVSFNGTDDVGVIVDGADPVFVPSNTSNAQTATDLAAEWNGDPELAAIATATAPGAGVFRLTFLDTTAHTVVAYKPAIADITGITNTTAAVSNIDVEASTLGSKVQIVSTAEGSEATIQVVSGTALDELGIETGTYFGTGTEEDWHDCAVLGYLASMAARLDLPGGSYPFDNLKLRARPGMELSGTPRTNLREQYCNTYERRTDDYPGEIHLGVTFGGINVDFVISTLWVELRLVEAVKRTQDRYTARKQRIPLTDEGITIVDNPILKVISLWAASGAIRGPDLTPYDPLTKITGYLKPTIADQPEDWLAVGKIGGWKITQQDAGSIKIVEINVEAVST